VISPVDASECAAGSDLTEAPSAKSRVSSFANRTPTFAQVWAFDRGTFVC